MHSALVQRHIDAGRKRVKEGDCPSTPWPERETLGYALLSCAEERDTLRALVAKLVEALEPFDGLAHKFRAHVVVEVCAPHPDNPSRRIEPLYVSDLESASAAILEARKVMGETK